MATEPSVAEGATNVLYNVLAAPIVFMLGVLAQQKLRPALARYFTDFSGVLPFTDIDEVGVTVAYGYVVPPNHSENYAVEHGDLMALLAAYRLCSRLTAADLVRFQDGHSAVASGIAARNLLAVSGPKWNPATDYCLRALGCPVRFTKSPKALAVVGPDGRSDRYVTQRDDGHLAGECYSVIAAGDRDIPGGSSTSLMVCAGRTTLSTNAALLFLNSLASSRRQRQELQSAGVIPGHKWAVILRTVRRANVPSILMGPLRPDDVDTSIVRVIPEAEFSQPFKETCVYE